MPAPCRAGRALAAKRGGSNASRGDLLYREVHWRRDAAEGAERWVLYQCADGRPFARKHLPASADPQARGYTLEDRQRPEGRRRAASGRVSIAWKEDGSPPVQRELDLPTGAVIDAGFDAAVRLHWQALMRGV